MTDLETLKHAYRQGKKNGCPRWTTIDQHKAYMARLHALIQLLEKEAASTNKLQAAIRGIV